MAMSPRILLFSAIGITLYLGLSLYHGNQLKKYPALKPGNGKGLSARAEEKTWVQVSTTKQVTAGPVQSQGLQEQAEGGSEDVAAGISGGQSQPAPAREQQQGLAGAPKLGAEMTPAPKEEDHQLAASDSLQAELKEAKARAAIAEGELERARLKAEAMFRYGQEQSRLLAPARLEAEVLRTRLQETRDKLRQAEQQVAALNNREQQLRKELDTLRSTGHEAKAPDAPGGEAGEPTPGAERAD